MRFLSGTIHISFSSYFILRQKTNHFHCEKNITLFKEKVHVEYEEQTIKANIVNLNFSDK